MGVDTDLAGIIRDIVQFLESLGDIDLPLKIENTRDGLLQRTKTKLASLTGSRGSTSPEPYLDMNAGKGLLQRNKSKHTEIEEYVGVEEQTTVAPSSHQDYYESFNEFGETIVDKIIKATSFTCDEQVEDKLREIYRTFTRAETMSKALKTGNLDQKNERKTFGFVRENIRSCWIGFVGSHLIIYGNNDDKQPPEIFSIRGYKARVAPNAVPKDLERAKSAFEIFCPGNKTLQFIASNPKEMEEWIATIGGTGNNIRDEDSRINEETIDIGASLTSRKIEESMPLNNKPDNGNGSKASGSGCGKKKDSIASPPALPVRLPPRRLPSLPNEKVLHQPSYERMDDAYEEDDIYHKIEDLRSYENVKEKSGNGVSQQGRVKKASKRKKSKDLKESREVHESPPRQIIETYDDVQTIVRDNKTPVAKEIAKNLEDAKSEKDESFLTYDDVAQAHSTVSADSPSVGESCESKVDRSPSKSPHKRWFLLDRVRQRKDSPKKEDKLRVEGRKNRKKLEKKDKGKSSLDSIAPTCGGLDSAAPTCEGLDSTTPTCGGLDLLSNYDDVSEYLNKQKVDDLSNYNCPPPPRPIYAKSPNHINVPETKTIDEEVLYDDISCYRNNATEESRDFEESGCIDYRNSLALRVSTMFERDDQDKSLMDNQLSMDSEHYQTPRKNSHHLNQCSIASPPQEEQQLYDDIAILEDFRTRQRDSVVSTGDKLTISIKRPWNRFGSGKKIATRDNAAVEMATKNKSSSDLEDVSEPNCILPSPEKNDAAKLNKLQKLYNKMESTLGKQPSGKSINPLLNKTRNSE